MTDERFKYWFHLGLGIAVAIAAAHNVERFCTTKKMRNVINIIIYAPLAVHEIRQAHYHLSQEVRQ